MTSLWTEDRLSFLIAHYSDMGNQDLARAMGLTVRQVECKGSKLKLRKSHECKASVSGITIWTEDMLAYLQNNFYKYANTELAKHLKLTLTVVRNKCKELGLKKMEMEYWTAEQTAYLIAHYENTGDVELAEYFQVTWPKKKRWTAKHIEKKRLYLKLKRTPEQGLAIKQANAAPGGRSFTIGQNTASKNLPDGYVANCIAWRNPELKVELLKYPQLLEVKRQQLLLSKAIKHGKTSN